MKKLLYLFLQILILIFASIGVVSTVSIFNKSMSIYQTIYNDMELKHPMEVDNFLLIPHVIRRKYSYTVARFCLDLIIRVVKSDKSEIKNLTHVSDFVGDDGVRNLGAMWVSENVIWIGFKGTTEVNEWLNNFHIKQISYRTGRETYDNLPPFMRTHKNVKIHSGFIRTYNRLRPLIMEKITDFDPTMQICLSGHSMGGALATILGVDLKSMGYNVTVYSFCSPRVGNDELSELVKQIKLPLYRIINQDDMIPQTPLSVSPNLSDKGNPYLYSHCGDEYKFSKNWNALDSNHCISIMIDQLKNIRKTK